MAKGAFRDWRKKFQEGGEVWNRRQDIAANALQGGLANAGSWDESASALVAAGMRPDSPWFKQLQMAYMGTGDPTGTWHQTPNGWVNVATSDLTAMNRPTWNPGFTQGGGIQAVLGAPQIGDLHHWASNLEKWFNQPGGSSWEGRTNEGGYWNQSPSGAYNYIDAFGRPVANATRMPRQNQSNNMTPPPLGKEVQGVRANPSVRPMANWAATRNKTTNWRPSSNTWSWR